MVAWRMRGLLLAIAALLILSLAIGGTAMAADLENTLYMDVPFGRVVIAMRPDLAPNHVAQIKALARRGFYDGAPFHRVIDGFMVQGGDPTGSGTGGSGHPLKAEFSSEKHVRGVTSMARAQDPNSADSQFFIMFAPNMGIEGEYTVWGRVISGMDTVDKIAVGEPPTEPTKIVKAYLGDTAATAAK